MASNEITSTTTNLSQLLDHDHHRRSDSEDHDALSFCDLMIGNDDTGLADGPASGDFDDQEEDDPLFEFMTSSESDSENIGKDKIIFCGKTITPGKPAVEINGNSGGDVRYPRKGLLVRRESFKKNQNSRLDVAPTTNVLTDGYGSSLSSSFRFGKFDGPKEALPETGGYYRSNSGSLRKQKVFIGLVMRFEPMMELSEIRKRQGRRSPAPMFPTPGSPVDGEEKSPGSYHHHHHHHHWGLLRSRWCRAHFMSALTKASFGCISS